MFLWAVRLAWHLHNRYNPKVEDARYAALRNEWGTHANAKMLTFYIMQWVGALLLTLPMVVIGTAPAGAAWLAVLFAGLTTLSILLESVADWQLARFKASGPPKGSICDRGLWAWSRHPNYFFEWSLWVGLALWGLAVGPFPWSLAGLVAPAMMYHFLVNVTGVRPTEEHMSRTRPEAFAEYARRTPAFFPRPPRR
jgi:steroid 5-alpha reductase family enzyme